jgi:hypothetical protein
MTLMTETVGSRRRDPAQGDGFPLDQSRVAYLRYLRRERWQSPRVEVGAAHARAKTEMLQLRLMESGAKMVPKEVHDAMIDEFAGLVLARLSGLPRNARATW